MPGATAVEMISAEMVSTPVNVPVDTVSTLLVAANRRRKCLLIINRSNERIDMKADAAAVLGEGIPLNPTAANANSIDDDIQGAHEWSGAHCNLTLAAVYGISTNGQKTVTVIEYTPKPSA